MPRTLPVIVDSRVAPTSCPVAAAKAAVDLAAALLADVTPSVAPTTELVLTTLVDTSTFAPERPDELVPAALKWGGATGRKNEA